MKSRSVMRLAIKVNEALMTSDDAIYDGKPESASLARPFGGEERLKYMFFSLFTNTRTGVRNSNTHIGDFFGLYESLFGLLGI